MKLKQSLKFRLVTGVILVLVLGATITPVLFFPLPAKAQAVIFNPHDIVKDILDKILAGLKTAGYVAFRNSLNLILGQAAQQTAEWLASGAPGQGPMFLQDPLHFAEKVGDNALGDALDTFAKDSGLSSQGLCDINPQLKLNILANLDPIYVQKNFSPQTNCSLTEMLKNAKSIKWDKVVSVNFQTGSAGQYQANLGTLITNDSRLKDSQKASLNSIVSKLSAAQNTFITTMAPIENLTAAQTGDMTSVEDSLTNQLELLIANTYGDSGTLDQPAYLEYWEKWAPACLAKDQQAFCSDQHCYQIMCAQSDPSKCESNFGLPVLGDCINVTRRVNDYTKQILDWYNTLSNMMKNTIDSINRGAYNPPALDNLNDLNTMFNPGASDLSVAAQVQGSVLQSQANAIANSTFARQLSGPINNVTGKISDIVNTPSTLVSEQSRQMVANGTASYTTVTGDAFADALSTFVGTLANKLMDRIKTGLNPNTNPEVQRNTPFLFGGDQTSNPGQAGAQAMFTDLATVSLKRGDKVDILTEFTNNQNCSNSGVTPASNNCTMDDDFRQAVTQQLTIREAMDQNLLHGDRKVGAVGIKDTNQDYSSRYSLTNIKKLRRARIVPLGLEIAAQDIATVLPDNGYTLKQVVDGFNDNTSPFYHLVDPDWVLKAPDLRCDMMAYSAVPVNGTNQRQQACVDMKDCISEDNKGNCLAYGYCTREKNVWQMGGDQCDSQYNSCQEYIRTADNADASYVKSTLDFSTCDQNNAGCKWYCDRFTLGLGANNQDTWACAQPGTSLSKTDWGRGQCTSLGGGYYKCQDPQNAIYFNRQAETCSSGSQGCSQWISAMPGAGANLLPNGSFEQYSGTLTNTVNGWTISGVKSQFVANQSLAQNGTVVAQIAPSDDWGRVQFVPGDLVINGSLNDWRSFLLDNYSYTISLAVNNQTDDSQVIRLSADDDQGTGQTIFQQTVSSHSGWQTLAYTFTQPFLVNGHAIKWETLRWGVQPDINITNQYVYFDALQLEVSQTASAYKDYASSGQLYFKKAPDYLKCYNRDISGALITSDNEVSCSKYAVACNRDEVGCDLYTPSNGDPALPAVTRDADTCPATCVGYQTFREQDTNFSAGRLAVNLIPATGQTCSANEAGCSEFTNLDAVQKGGEGKEYYSYVRPCRQPDNACSYYYTWVGSDTTGYQLQRYYLEKSGTGAGPDGVLSSDQAQALWGACSGPDDVSINPHCKQFYDNTGASYFMLYENTISCSTDCHPLRKTTLVAANYCPTTSQSGVSIPGTSWQQQGNGIPAMGVCTYMAIPSQGATCSAINDGCRGYKGNAAYNVRQIFLDTFENGSSWTSDDASTKLSSESIYVGGHSLQVSASSQQPVTITRDVSGLLTAGKAYQISFWIKGAINGARFGITGNGLSNPVSLNATNDWQLVTIGPYYVTTLPSGLIQLAITTTPSLGDPDVVPRVYTYYIDNILLKETTDNIYLIQDSWTTPRTCDYNAQGQPDSMVGCQSYINHTNQVGYFRGFSSLCQLKAVGCEAMIDTHNSTNAFGDTFNATSSPVTVPPDNIEYLINDSTKSCTSADKGCQRFGLPTLSRTEVNGQLTYKVTGWSDQFLKNNPDLYTQKPTLCQANGLGCQEFMPRGSSTPVYFRDPLDGLCEYRENINGQTGWFKKGASDLCYPGYTQPGTNIHGIKNFGENGYLGLVGLCPQNESGCKEFIDPLATASPYYYLDNAKLDKSSCQGVSQKQGCVLLNDTTQTTETYNAEASYKKSADNNSDLVAPVNCATPGQCVGGSNPGTACTSNNDCQGGGTCNLGAYCTGGGQGTDYCKYCYNFSNPNNSLVNNADTLLKVGHDRLCGEWLYCAGSQTIWDKASGQSTEVCDQLARCQKLSTSGNTAMCTKLVTPPAQILTEPVYTSRNVSWSGMDYSGYSLLGLYPPDLLTVKSSGLQCVGGANGGNSCKVDSDCPDGYCDTNYNLTYADQGVSGKICDFAHKCPSGQICTNPTGAGVCVVPKTCRAYPQVDSPFTQEAGGLNGVGGLYSGLNVCQQSDNASCQCFYEKMEYGQGAQTQYWNYKNSNIPQGVCTLVGDTKHTVGTRCLTDQDCGASSTSTPPIVATCSFKTKKTDAIGLRGYCLESDTTKPDALNSCLTWWPSATTGDPDINNLFPEAGYRAADNQGQVCANWMTPSDWDVRTESNSWVTAGGTGFFPDQADTDPNQNTMCRHQRNDVLNPYSMPTCECPNGGAEPPCGRYCEANSDCTGNGGPSDAYCDTTPPPKVVPPTYYKSFYVAPGGGDLIKSYDLNALNNAFGDQFSLYTHGGLNNITRDMIANLYVNVCADNGGNQCGGCNDIGWMDNPSNPGNDSSCNLLACDKVTRIQTGPNAHNDICWRYLDPTLTGSDIDPNCYAYSTYYDNTQSRPNQKGVDTNQSHATFVFEACFNGSSPSSKLTGVKFKMLRVGDDTNSSPGLWLIVRGFLFEFRPGCQHILNIAQSGQPSPAFTNRVNNKQNYYGASEQLDGVCDKDYVTPCSTNAECGTGTCILKTYDNQCTPWGGVDLSSSSPSSLVVAKDSPTTCSADEVAAGSIYTNPGDQPTPISGNLFIKDYTAWHFEEGSFSYISDANIKPPRNYIYDRRSNEVSTKSPTVYSVAQNPHTQQYQLGRAGTVTVGTVDSGDIQRQQNYIATLKLYGRANENHMPIRELIIDWTDGTTPYGQNANLQAKNHMDICAGVCSGGKGSCKTDNDCQSPQTCIRTFGDSAEACTEQFWQFSHTYTCDGVGSPGWNASLGACVFKPKVYLKDNWGWCSGGVYAGDNSCYGTGGAGTAFAGRIIIYPSGASGGGTGGQGNVF